MALQLGALRDALLDAGAKADKAAAAAEELATYDKRFADFDIRLEREFADVRADLRLLKWGQSVTLAGIIAVLIRVFLH